MQDEKMCSEDYIGCLGMGLTDIQRMIPNDSLTSCIKDGESVTDADWYSDGKIGTIVEMLMMNLDNNLLGACEALALESFAKICAGDGADPASVSTCDKPFDDIIGTRSLTTKIIAEGKHAEILGLMDTTKITYGVGEEKDNVGATTTSASGRAVTTGGHTENTYPSIILPADASNGLTLLKQDVDMVANRFLQLNPRLAFCTEGRDLSQIKARAAADPKVKNSVAGGKDRTKTEARFPRLADPYINLILQAGVSKATVNYNKKLKDILEETKKSMKPSKGGIIDQNVCWMPKED